MNKAYIQLLTSRLKYFEDKKITELTNDEIKEYMALKEECFEVFGEVREKVKQVWYAIHEFAKPYAEASKKYQERVLNREG